MAKKTNLNVSVGVDTTAYRKGWEEVAKITVAGGQQTEKEAEKMVNAMTKKFEKLSLKQQIRQFEQLAAKMEQTGQSGGKAFADVVKKAGELKATQSDLKDLIEASRPDAPFKAMSNAIAAGTQAFAGLQGAMTLLGGDNEELQKQMVKLQAVMALAEATKSLDMMGDAFGQVALIVKTNVIPSLATLKGALIATGIGAVVVALGVAIEYFNSMANAAEKAAQEAERAMKFAEGVNALDQKSLQESINRRKILGQSEEELFQVKQRFTQRAIDNLLESEKKGADVQDKIYQLRQQMALDESEFRLQQHEKQTQAQKEASQKQLEYYKAGVELQKQLRYELGQANSSTWQQDINDLEKWRTESAAILNKAGISDVALTQLYAKKMVEILKKQREEISNLPQQGLVTVAVQGKMEGGPLKMPEPRNFKISADYAAELARQNREVTITAQEMNAALNSASADGLANMATAIGTAIATGQDLGQAIGKSFLTSLADFLQQMGKMMITTASIWSAFQKALVAQPELAIALGIAAVGAGAALRAHVQNGAKPEAFASGGMVNSPTFALIGDNLNAHNNPEFVLRQDQLKRMMSGGNMNLSGEFVIRGNDLIYVLDESNRRRNR